MDNKLPFYHATFLTKLALITHKPNLSNRKTAPSRPLVSHSETLNLPLSAFSHVSVLHSVSLCSCTVAGQRGRTLLPGWLTPTRGQPPLLQLNGPRCCSSALRTSVSMATLPRERESGKSRHRATVMQTHWWAKIHMKKTGLYTCYWASFFFFFFLNRQLSQHWYQNHRPITSSAC